MAKIVLRQMRSWPSQSGGTQNVKPSPATVCQEETSEPGTTAVHGVTTARSFGAERPVEGLAPIARTTAKVVAACTNDVIPPPLLLSRSAVRRLSSGGRD